MGKNIDLKAKFKEYFNQPGQPEGLVIKWLEAGLEAAYLQGARDMAQDTLNTLGDYACAVAGLEAKLIKPEEVYDCAYDSLMVYYTKVLDNAEKEQVP